MNVEIRPLTPADKFRHSELMAHAFSGGQVQTPPPSPADAPPQAGENEMAGTFGLFENGALRAAYSIAPFQVHWGQSVVLPMGGIAGVATWAEARGRGHVGSLLRHSLETMRAAGQVVSALYPFSWAFYRRYGWEWVGAKQRVTLPLAEVRAAPEGKNVREVSEKGADQVQQLLAPIYTAFAHNYRGVCDSATHRWQDSLGHRDNRTTYVYVHQAPGQENPDGYLLWRYGRDGKNASVRELIANSPEAHRGLMSVLHYLGTQADKADVSPLPSDHLLWHHAMHWDMETKGEPVFMGRVVDVPAALAALMPPADFPNSAATLAIRDEHAPWNEGKWLVACENATVTCAPAPPNSVPGLSLDVQAFSQAFWGTPSLETLTRAGRVTAANPSAVAWLGRLLSGPPVFTLDDF